MSGPVEVLDGAPEIVALRRGDHVIALNPGDRPAAAPRMREVLLHTHDVQRPPDLLHPGEAVVGTTC